MDKIFICREETSNKFWGYKLDQNTNDVEVRWGRLGLEGQKQIKAFPSKWKRDDFIEKKTREKLDGLYKEVTIDEYNLQLEIAKDLGVGSKVQEMCFVVEDGCYISEVKGANLYLPGVKPKVYAKIIGRREAGNENAPVTHLLFDVDRAYRIIPDGTHPVLARMCVTSKEVIQPSDECASLATAVGGVIGAILMR